MHYYPHHIGDFIRDTSRLSDSQSMAYLRLLWIYYDTEKPLIDDAKKLAFQIGANADDVSMILEHFFDRNADGMRTHSRCETVIEEYRSKKEKAANSANARWKNAKAMRTHSERNENEPKNDANQEPITNNQETKDKTLLSPDESDGHKLPACPHQKIIALYGSILPELPQPRIWEGAAEKALAARWRWLLTASKPNGARYAETADEGMDWFKRMFEYVRESDFLMGSGSGSRQWSADLRWIVKADNFAKIISGNYHKDMK